LNAGRWLNGNWNESGEVRLTKADLARERRERKMRDRERERRGFQLRERK